MPRPVRLDVDGLAFTEDYRILDKLKLDMKYLNTMHIEYGVVNNDKYPADDPRGRGGMSVAEVLKRNEYGLSTTTAAGKTINLPPRPLFKQSLSKGKIEAATYMQYIAHQWGNNSFNKEMFHTLAKKMPETIRAELTDQNLIENHPKTIQQKENGFGDDTVLFDTGVLYRSFDGVVKRGNIHHVKRSK
jgi:hypothetical protein